MLDFRGRVEQALKALDEDRPAEAEQGFRAALDLNPRDDQLLHLLGVALVQQQRAMEAIEPLRKAISLNRRVAEYHNALGCALRDASQHAEALESFGRALKLDPRLDSVHYNVGQSHQRMGEFARAEEIFCGLQARRPGDIELVGALARLRWQASDHEGAIEILREGIARHPSSGELRFMLGDHLLTLGRFEEGWACYLWRTNRIEWRRAIGRPFSPADMPARLPQSLEGRTFRLHGEQGIGDELFFLRFARFLRERGARVSARLTPRIVDMVGRSGVLDEIEPSPARFPADDSHVLLGDLPYVLDAYRVPVPPAVPLAPAPQSLAAVDALLGALPRPWIGLTWRAGTGPAAGNRNLLYKEAPFDALSALVRDFPGSLLVLQRQPRPGEVDALRQACGPRVVDLSTLNEDLEVMLALMARIDEYVGVSNTNVHLRAGVGRGARVLVSNGAEFRWVAQGRGSPWFPDMTVYRQAASGSWQQAMASLKYDLSY